MSKSSSRNIIIWVGGVFAAIVAVIAVLYVLPMLTNENSNQSAGNNNADIITEFLPIIGVEEMYEILHDRTGNGFFVYVGRPTCPNCVDFEPNLRAALQYLGRELNYFEVDLAQDVETDEEFDFFLQILSDFRIDAVPLTLYVQNGEVIDTLRGIHSKQGVLNFFESNGGLN